MIRDEKIFMKVMAMKCARNGSIRQRTCEESGCQRRPQLHLAQVQERGEQAGQPLAVWRITLAAPPPPMMGFGAGPRSQSGSVTTHSGASPASRPWPLRGEKEWVDSPVSSLCNPGPGPTSEAPRGSYRLAESPCLTPART